MAEFGDARNFGRNEGGGAALGARPHREMCNSYISSADCRCRITIILRSYKKTGCFGYCIWCINHTSG